jgi:uncharacterized repeat protein (TIGR01451 family)
MRPQTAYRIALLVSTAVSVLFAMALPPLLNAQTLQPSDDLIDHGIHVFQPAISPAARANDLSRPQGQSGISFAAAQQINALVLEKLSRTPAQKKISSQLLHTARMLRNQQVADGVPYLETGVELDAKNRLFVDINADVSDDLLARLASAGATIVVAVPRHRNIRAFLPSDKLEQIASWPGIRFINPRQLGYLLGSGGSSGKEPKSKVEKVREFLSSALSKLSDSQSDQIQTNGSGSKNTEGDVTHNAAKVRSVFGIDGAGVKIGVISDGVSNLASSQATGDLGSVTVLTGQTGSGDEGTAMLEIIHDIAPGAKLYFATAMNGIASFAQNILDLRTAGCDIIVDDVGYFVETPFQDGQASNVKSNTNGGIVIQAVNTVTANGALYFSSAGNSGSLTNNTSGTWEGDFMDGGPATAPLSGTGNVHLFGTVAYNTITSSSSVLNLFWADPLGGSANDYDLYILNSTGTSVVSASTNVQTGTQDPYEQITYPSAGNRVVIIKHAGSAARFLHLAANRGKLTVATAGATVGHNGANKAYSIGATPANQPFSSGYPSGPYPNPFNSSNVVELFSSDGPRRIFFRADSSVITPGNFSSTGGQLLQKPDFTAADGVTITGAGGFSVPFYGTSAAAPHAAAIAALIKSAQPSLTNSDIYAVMAGTAIDIMQSGVDRDSGSGIIMAYEAINSLGISSYANPQVDSAAASENPGNGDGSITAGEGAKLMVKLTNQYGGAAASNISATLTTSTPGVTITQPAASSYPDLAVGQSAFNVTPFTFTLAESFSNCASSIEFTMTIGYTGGPGATRDLSFTVPLGIGPVTINGVLGKPPSSTGLTAATGTQTGRIYRDGVASQCGTSKTYPGAYDTTGSRVFDSYTFTACSSGCAQVGVSNPTVSSQPLFSAAYASSFVPSSISTNYFADAGSSGTSTSYGFNVVAGQKYTVVVHELNPAGATGASYSVSFPGCALKCIPANNVPVAKVKNVTVGADSGGKASASIDDGSYDPDRDAITITQTPAGPYSLGQTTVLLTIVDTKGATAQASATVTVVVCAVLRATMSHTGNFIQGQTGNIYTIAVNNSGSAATNGVVTVTDSLPAGLTATAMSGTGWNCALASLTCTSSDSLAVGGSYAPITLTVNAALNAPSQVTNRVTVSGGSEIATANSTAGDQTPIAAAIISIAVSPTIAEIQRGLNSTAVTLTISGNIDFPKAAILSAFSSGPISAQTGKTATPVGMKARTVTLILTRNPSIANMTKQTALLSNGAPFSNGAAGALAALMFGLPAIIFASRSSAAGNRKRNRWFLSLMAITLAVAPFGCTMPRKTPTSFTNYNVTVTAAVENIQSTMTFKVTVYDYSHNAAAIVEGNYGRKESSGYQTWNVRENRSETGSTLRENDGGNCLRDPDELTQPSSWN